MTFGFPAEFHKYRRNRRQQIPYPHSSRWAAGSKCSHPEPSLASDWYSCSQPGCSDVSSESGFCAEPMLPADVRVLLTQLMNACQGCFAASGCTKLVPAKARFIYFSYSFNKILTAQFWAGLRVSERWRQPWESQTWAGMLFQVHITYRVFTSENPLTLYKILLFALQMFTQRKLLVTVHIYI